MFYVVKLLTLIVALGYNTHVVFYFVLLDANHFSVAYHRTIKNLVLKEQS